VVVVATSSPQELIMANMLRPGAVVCDVSRPPNVSPAVCRLRNDVVLIDGGVVELPGRPDLGFHFGFPRGLAYACMAETIMLALEKRYVHTNIGRHLGDDTLEQMRALAHRHGFRVADLRQAGRALDRCDWDAVRRARLGGAAAGSDDGDGGRIALAGGGRVRGS